MADHVLYFCSYLISSIRDHYGRVWHSRAGLNEKRGTIKSLRTDGRDVTVVSPVTPEGRGFDLYRPKRFYDEETETPVLVPPCVNVFGVTPINYAFTTVFTFLFALVTYGRADDSVTLSYNFRPETSIPGLIGKYLFGAPYLLQYEDALSVHRARLRRVSAKYTKMLCNSHLDGGVCSSTTIESLLRTDNTAIVRGYPSIGMPDELPDREYDDQDDVVVMFAGHFDPVRGIDRFLAVAPRLQDDDVRFWISGTGRDSEKERVRHRIDEIDDERITYFGTLPWDEYRKRVVSADLLVNFQSPDVPISRYTFPSKLLDFMSSGNVIVSTDMCDLATAFPDELVIGGTSNEELETALSETIDRYRTGDVDTGPRAREWVQAHCTHEFAGERFGDVICNASEE